MSDAIYELEKHYYLGNYQTCVNKANSMDSCKESIYYLCLSYLQLKKFDNLDLELSKSSEECVKSVQKFVSYVKNPGQKEFIIREVEDSSKEVKDDLTKLVLSAILVQEKSYANALRLLHRLDSLAAGLARIGIYTLMDRIDLAEQQLQSMSSRDPFNSLTLLASAQVSLASGRAREAYETGTELVSMSRETPLLCNLLTAAAIGLHDYELAKRHAESALNMDNDNIEATINSIFLLTKVGGSQEVKKRHRERIKLLCPDHEYVREFERLEEELVAAS